MLPQFVAEIGDRSEHAASDHITLDLGEPHSTWFNQDELVFKKE